MLTGFDLAEMREGHDETDSPMSTHAKVADFVEKDHARNTRFVARFDHQRADEDIRSAGFIDNGRAELVVSFAEEFQPVRNRTVAEFGPTTDDDASGFAASVGVENL